MRMNRLTDIDRIGAHLNSQCNFANHVTRVGTNDAAALNLAVAVGFVHRFVRQIGAPLNFQLDEERASSTCSQFGFFNTLPG